MQVFRLLCLMCLIEIPFIFYNIYHKNKKLKELLPKKERCSEITKRDTTESSNMFWHYRALLSKNNRICGVTYTRQLLVI